MHDIDRTEVGTLGIRGSSGSLREVNIKTTSEGALKSKATEEPCVGSLGSPKDYVTKKDFKTFVTSVFQKLEELKSSNSSTQAAPQVQEVQTAEARRQHTEALKTHSEAMSKLTSAISELQTSIKALPTKDDASSAVNSVTIDDSFYNKLKTELASIGKDYASDLEAAGYLNYDVFKKEIKDSVNSALVLGATPFEGHPKAPATRGDLSNLVCAIGEQVRTVTTKFLEDHRVAHNLHQGTMDKLYEETRGLQGAITSHR